MKKLLVLLLALVMCVSAFASCNKTPAETTPAETTPAETTPAETTPAATTPAATTPAETTPAATTPAETTPAETTPDDEPTFDAEAAADYIYNLYKDKSITATDFEVTAKVAIEGIVHTVEWSVDTDKVTIEVKDKNTYIINVDEKTAEEVKYVLTATITGGDQIATKSFNLTIPAYAVMSWDAYMAAESGAAIPCVEGVVTGIVSKSTGATYNCVFLQDATGGAYYVYGMDKDPIADLGLEIGMTASASGTKDIYNGTHEIKSAVVSVVSTEKTPVAPMDYTLYCIKYVNQWDGSWLRRGVDQVTGQDAGTVVRHAQYVENHF